MSILTMQGGKLRHRVTFQRATSARDDGGGTPESWADLTTCWGSIEPLNGRELEQAQRLVATVTHQIIVRYSSALATLSPKDRATGRGKTFEIQNILNLELRNRQLQILAIEVPAVAS